MCLIALAWQQHADFPLVVVANRDEFFNRPTAPAGWWADPAGLYAGRDLQAGGTWLGVSRSGRFAALTNFRDPARLRPQVRSRGELVVQALASACTAMRFGQLVSARRREYNPFNLIAFDGTELVAVEAEAERTSVLPAEFTACPITSSTRHGQRYALRANDSRWPLTPCRTARN